MGFMARIRSQGVRARIAVAASAAAVAATVWGVVALVDPGHHGSRDGASGQTQNQNRTPDGKNGKNGEGEGGGNGGPAGSGPLVPETIAHASESGGDAVNITIDDGPDPRWTPRILDVLKRYDVKATFCMVGPQAKAHPDLVKKVVQGGHRLCDHTMDHDTRMDKKPVAYQEQQILEAKKLIEEAAGGAKVEYYRAPGGAFTPDSRRIAAANGMRPSAGTSTPRTSRSPVSPRSSTRSSARSTTARRSSSTTPAATARSPSRRSTRCSPGWGNRAARPASPCARRPTRPAPRLRPPDTPSDVPCRRALPTCLAGVPS